MSTTTIVDHAKRIMTRLGWLLFADDRRSSRFDQLTTEWLRLPIAESPKKITRSMSMSGLTLSKSAQMVANNPKRRLVRSSAFEDDDFDVPANATSRASSAALREQLHRSGPATLGQRSLVERMTRVLRIVLLQPFAVELRVSNASGRAVGESSTRLYPFGRTLAEHFCVADTLLTHEEHGCIAYACAISPLMCSDRSSDRLVFSGAMSTAFGQAIDRIELLRRLCAAVLAKAPAPLYAQYKWLLDAALMNLYGDSLRAGFLRNDVLDVAAHIRFSDRRDVRTFRMTRSC